MSQINFRKLQLIVLISSTVVVLSHQACGPVGQPIGTGLIDSTSLAVPLPDVDFSLAPQGTVSSSTVQFQFSGSNYSFIECELDGSAPYACQSPYTLSALADGPHELFITPVSISTTNSSVSQKGARRSRRWTVDTTAPTVTITSQPSSGTTNTSANFTFSAVDATSSVQSIDCKIDSAAFSPCATTISQNYSGLAVGAHTFSIRATDTVGNTGPSTYSWSILAPSPTQTVTVALNSIPKNPTNLTAAAFTFSGASNFTNVTFSYNCKLDGANVTCSNGQYSTTVTQGSHSFQVEASDASTGVKSQIASYAWQVDTTLPTIQITSQPASLTNTNSPSFSFTATDSNSGVARTECALDAVAFAQCTSPKNLVGLNEGLRTFKVRSIDSAGNTSNVASYSFTVDTLKPTVTLTSSPTSSTSTSASFAFTISEANTSILCSLDGAALAPCTSSTTMNYSGLAVGTHTAKIQATDQAGNTGFVTHSWDVQATQPAPDTQAPTVAITSPTNNSSYTAAQTLKITASATDNVGVTKIEFYKDNALVGTDTASPYEYNYSISSTENGNHSFYAKAFDAAGNTQTSSAITLGIGITTPSGTNYFNWGIETDTSLVGSQAGPKNLGFLGNTSRSADTAHSGQYSMKMVVRGDDGGNNQMGADLFPHINTPFPYMGGPRIYYRWWMKILPGFSWGKVGTTNSFGRVVTGKTKSSRTGGDYGGSNPSRGYTGYVWANGFWLEECDAVAGVRGGGCPSAGIRINYDLTKMADGQWHEYVVMVKLNSTVTSKDAEFKAWVDGTQVGQALNFTLHTDPGTTHSEGWASWMVKPYFQLNGETTDGGTIYVDDISTDDFFNSIY